MVPPAKTVMTGLRPHGYSGRFEQNATFKKNFFQRAEVHVLRGRCCWLPVYRWFTEGLSLFYLPLTDFTLYGLSLLAVFYGLDWIATVPPTVNFFFNCPL